MTTPTREELAAMIDPYWDDDLYRLKRVADVVLPLLRERDDKIVSLDTSVASLEATIAEKDARIAELEAESRSWAVAVAGRNASAVPPTIDLASSREYACSDNCKNVYQAHYDKHEPNCQGEEILELCDEIERLRAFISSGALGVQVAERIDKLVAERDAALADLDRAVKMFGKAEEQAWADLRATKDSFLEQRDEARAEVRRLKARLERPMVHTTIAESCAQSGCAALHLSTHEDRADDQ